MKIKLGIMFLVVFFILGLISYTRWDVKFRPQAWTSSDLVKKYRMALYIERNGMLNGKTKSEVITLLGPPDMETSDSLFFYIDQPFGYKDGFTVLLDQGKVTKAYVRD